MKKILISLGAILLAGCDALPTGPTDVSSPSQIISDYFVLRKGSAGFELAQDHADAADQKWKEVAACLGADPSIAKGHIIRLWAEGQKLPCGGGGCFGGETLDLFEAYTTWDQGWRHEMIHMALKKSPKLFPDEDYRNCPSTDSPRINQKPWSCQFSWVR